MPQQAHKQKGEQKSDSDSQSGVFDCSQASFWHVLVSVHGTIDMESIKKESTKAKNFILQMYKNI